MKYSRSYRWFLKVFSWLFQKRIDKYVAWRNYEIGFSGFGTSSFDEKPEFEKPWLPAWMKKEINKEMNSWQQAKKDAFKYAYKEALGEDLPT